MASTGARRPSPRHARIRRFTFAGLLLLALAVPAGWVAAGEATARYIVVFDPDAVTTEVPLGDLPGDGRRYTFRQMAGRANNATTGGAAASGDRRRHVDTRRVTDHVREIVARDRVRVDAVYRSALGGFAASLNSAQLRALAADPLVSAIVPDQPMSFGDGPAAGPDGAVHTTNDPALRVPPGVKRVGARSPQVTAYTSRVARIDADVAILDSGIESDHPDLNVVGGYNCTRGRPDRWDDTNGHGTHVAGIVGALDNRIGVVGVAPGVRLWSVKVLNSAGEGFVSWILCGIDWVTAQRDPDSPGRPLFEVANMSMSFGLVGGDDSECGRRGRDAVHQAICRSVAAGTVYVVAAGNDSHNARRNRPAAYDEVITVSAMADYDGRGGGRGEASDSCPFWSPERDDSFTAFSNYGPDVDLIAPGKCILSTYVGQRYAWMSGTSMATPHVSGAAALYRAMFPRATPAQVRLALEAVGTLDWRTNTDPDGGTSEKAVWIGQFRRLPDFSIAVVPPNGAVRPGDTLAITVNLSRGGGFDDRVTLELADAPNGFSAQPAVARRRSGVLTIDVAGRVHPGRYAMTIVARGGDLEARTTIEINVRRGAAPRAGGDPTPPRPPAVSVSSADLPIDPDRPQAPGVYVGNADTLWVRAGTRGSVVLEVNSRDPDSGISGYEATVSGDGWSADWIGPTVDGRLRLDFGPSGADAQLLVSAVNGAGLESEPAVGRLMRDGDRPTGVEWTSLESGATQVARSPLVRLNWRGGSDASSGLADRLLVGRYRTPLRPDGTFDADGFMPDGELRLLADGSVETGLAPGYCYAWAVRSVDNVGNTGPAVVSGYLVVVERGPR